MANVTEMPPLPEAEDERKRRELLAAAQPVKLVSIDDVTIGQLMSLSFKLFIAWIPLAFVIAIIWLIVHIVAISVAGIPTSSSP